MKCKLKYVSYVVSFIFRGKRYNVSKVNGVELCGFQNVEYSSAMLCDNIKYIHEGLGKHIFNG